MGAGQGLASRPLTARSGHVSLDQSQGSFRRWFMRSLSRVALTLTLLVVLLMVSPAWARVAAIETTAPLQDHAEQSINAALQDALETAMKGALAMGLPWVKISRALVLENVVTVQLLATDTDPEGEDASWQGGRPGALEPHEGSI
jgi:hypothetical protein